MPSVLPLLEFASHSDVGKVRLANEDAHRCDGRMGLFVVCDGLGGRPSGEAASHIIASSLGHLIRRRLRKLTSLDVTTLRELLKETAIDLSTRLRAQASEIDALANMGATISALLVDGRHAFILHAGDSRAYLLRQGALRRLTDDHYCLWPATDDTMAGSLNSMEAPRRRLLTQFIGIGRPLEPQVVDLPLRRGDRLLLCSDGLTDVVSDDTIAQMIAPPGSLGDICKALVDTANSRGGPDNITAVLVDFKGVRTAERAELRANRAAKAPPPAKQPRRGIAAQFHAALMEVKHDLDWLLVSSRELKGVEPLAGYAAVKRLLGPQVFHEYMKLRPSESPAHVFHRACVLFESVWRLRYEANQAALEPLLDELTNGAVRLSPLLPGDETAAILRAIWRDWLRVEDRYLTICRRETFDPTDHALDALIEHMHSSVRTLIGLMEFFPKFMRDTPAAGPLDSAHQIQVDSQASASHNGGDGTEP
jgi:protein phosphatase